ncbi:MAG: hypothetical protein K0Q70_80 [Rhodospirillales bacterium]|nr:hypothetical protein [Rhodospirillales bacterium]
MKKTIGWAFACLALIAASLFALGMAPPVSANDLIVAQVDKEPPKLPEVTPGFDNPNNPAVPGHNKTDPQSTPTGDTNRQRMPEGSTAEGRSRCGTLTDTLARRRCLEELQRSRNN